MREIGTWGWMHLVVFGVTIPIAAVRTARRVAAGPLPPKKNYFVSVILQLLAFGIFSFAVARREWIVLFPAAWPPGVSIATGTAALILMVGLARPMWRRRVEARSRKIWLFMPRDGTERALWAATSLAAGLSEELTWRGVQFALLWRLTGSALAAAAASALIFGFAHYMQGWRSMGIICGIALVFQGLAWMSGSLYVSIAVHALYDVAAGLHYGRFGRELGYPIEPPPPAPAPASTPAV